MTCNQCKYWDGKDPVGDGTCRGVPPTPIQVKTLEETLAGVKVQSGVNSYFSTTRGATPACGAFKPKEVTA